MKPIEDIEQWGPIDAKILYMSFWFNPIAKSSKTQWKAIWPDVDGFFEQDRVTFIWNKNDTHKKGSWAIDNIILNNTAREGLWQSYQAALSDLNNLAKIILKTSDDDKLFFYSTDLYKKLTNFWGLGIIPELANFAAEDYLKKKLFDKFSKGEIEEIVQTLLASENLSFHQESELALLLASKKGNFQEYADKWYWVENGYFESKVLTAKYFSDKLNIFSQEEIKEKIIKIESYPNKIKQKKQGLVRKYKIDKKILDIADKLAFSIWWQDHRKGVSLRLHSVIDILSQAAVRKLKVNFDDIMHYTAEEWLALFNLKPQLVDEGVLKKRLNFFVFNIATSNELVYELYGEEARARYDLFDLDSESDDLSKIVEFGGTVVNRGKVTGKVKVLLSYRQSDEMQRGEILVAPMTSPDYILSMRKSAAIITDVGGLMSHAAIVSRELGVPCIVGTKIATKILKDGDMVEVDANKGIIKKLN